MIKHIPAILLTLGLTAWFQEIFSIEWSFPYCSNQVDGPASAVWGMPLPYIRWSGLSSLEYFWMPTILILNIALLFAVAFPFVSWAIRRIELVSSPTVKEGPNNASGALLDGRATDIGLLTRWLIAGIGAILILSFGAWTVLQIQIGLYKIPVSNIASENSYSEFRPVGFGFKSLRYECTPLK